MTASPAENFVDLKEILPLLGPVKKNGDWFMAKCPAHDDEHPSLGLSSAGVLKCFTGCSFKDVMAALRGPAPIQPLVGRIPVIERMAALYEYKDANGVVVAEKARFELTDGRKTFKWRLPGAEGWPSPSGVVLANLPLYGLGLLRERPTEPVYFVEGEKACEACWKQGLVAVTHAGGAATKDFGQSLDVLKGRTVYLWADNDAPGAAFMTLVQAKLEGLNVDVRLVSVPIAVPAKADAFDYFALGGTADQLHTASPYEPVITILAEDALRVAIPSTAGLVTFDFSEMEKGARALDCALTISCQASRESYNERLNLDSSSARTQLRRDLEDFFGKEHGWTSLLNKAVYRAREAYLLQERAVELFDVPNPMGEVMLIPPLTVADGPTIFFGDGSSGKSYIAFLMALCSVYGFEFVGHRVPMMRVMIIDYEDSESNVKRRINRLCAGLGDDILPIGIYYWNARGIPLKDQWEAIKRSCSKNGIGWLIIDSAAPASGGPPEDSISALAFFRALKRIGLPALIIAHITKGEKTDKPFGSVFWHNEARRTWFIKRIQEEDADEIDIGLYNRKVNDGRKPLPIGLRMTFDGIDGPVTLTSQSLADVPELLSETSAQNQIWETLTQPMTVAEIAAATGIPAGSMSRYLKKGPFAEAGRRESTRKGGQPATLWAREFLSGS